MKGFWIAPGYEEWFPENRRSLDALGHAFGIDLASHRKRTKVARGHLTDSRGHALDGYFKVYASRSGAFDGLARRSRALLEARNLGLFRRWGISAAEVVACGYQRRAAGLCSHLSFLITRTIPDAPALRDFWTARDQPADPHRRQILIDQLARQTRLLHQHHFFHQDLKWRNLLVDNEDQLHWIDCPNGHFSRLPLRRRHGRIKDLATLDKVAKERCTQEERRRFLRSYLQNDDPAVLERWARAVVRYRRRRQD